MTTKNQDQRIRSVEARLAAGVLANKLAALTNEFAALLLNERLEAQMRVVFAQAHAKLEEADGILSESS